MNTLMEFAQDRARRYLQSVVFVDDKIFDKRSGMPVDLTGLPKPRKPVFRVESEGTTPPTVVQEDLDRGGSNYPYHPKALVSSFAREGIICALYEPPEGFPTNPDSEIFKLCERADIIILDWVFSGDGGEKALDLITALVKQSNEEFPHHTRLLSIYTDDPSLIGVANKIADRLIKEGFESEPQQSQCRLKSGAARLVVFGKDLARFGTEEEQFTVKDVDLASRLISEFADMNLGILPSYALHGLAAIRRNSKRVLDRFHSGMDGAFLLHRKLISESEEAFDQLPELFADEIRAVIEDEHFIVDAERIATSMVENNEISNLDRELIVYRDTGAKANNVAKKLVDDQGSVPVDHQHFAALFSNRTQYSGTSRILSYGTVIRRRLSSQEPWVYAFCLIPVCDSLRLNPEKNVRFPFWTLQQGAYLGSLRGRGLVLYLPDGVPIGLAAGGKASEMLWTEEFLVDAATKTVKADITDGLFKCAILKREVEWVGQLKPLHAQRIAHDIAQGLSRVGLVEAEWLRLLCDR